MFVKQKFGSITKVTIFFLNFCSRTAERQSKSSSSSSRSSSSHQSNSTTAAQHQLNLSPHPSAAAQQQALLLQQQQQAAAQAQALREQQERERLERERQIREEQQRAQLLHQQQQQQHQQLLQQQQHQQQQQQRELQIKQERENQARAAQAAAVQASQQQDLGLARLGALGALADLADGGVGGDLLNEVPSTINYEDLVIGNQAAAHAGVAAHNFVTQQQAGHQAGQSRNATGASHHHKSSNKNDQKSWLNRGGDLLDLSSGDSRDNTPTNTSTDFNQHHQQTVVEQQGGKDGNLIPQIVMNPWDPNQAPVMTLAPLANVMQAYQQQWLNQQAGQGGNDSGNANAISAAGGQQEAVQTSTDGGVQLNQASVEVKEEESYPQRERVVCLPPDEEMGFLLNLPPPCNVLVQPSSVGISGKPRESPFAVSFQKFLKGEVVTPKPVPEPDKYPNVVEEKPLPGKKAYIPPYTPKSALRNSLQRSRGGPAYNTTQRNGRNYNLSQVRSTSNNRNNHLQNQFGRNSNSKLKSGKDSDDDDMERFTSNAILPKRETSKRAAKEKSSAKRHMQEKV